MFQAANDSFSAFILNPLDNTQTSTVLRSFPGYSDRSIGNAEGNISIDDWMVALVGRKTTGPFGLNDMYVIVYDIQNDLVLSESRFDNKFTTAADRIDWVSVSQSGNYVVFSWAPDGTARYQGVEVYQVVNGALVFMRQLSPVAAHGDLGYDSFGNEVYVQADDPSRPEKESLEGSPQRWPLSPLQRSPAPGTGPGSSRAGQSSKAGSTAFA